MTEATERIEVQRAIGAEPPAIFRVLCDPQGHVAIDSSGMLMAADGEPVAGAGDTFVVHMDREALNDYPLGLYDVTVQITTFVPDREIAWTILSELRPQIGHVYGYTLEPLGAAGGEVRRSSPRTTAGPRSTRCGGRPGSSRSCPTARCGRRSASSPGPWPRGAPARRSSFIYEPRGRARPGCRATGAGR
jgi:hypothetical protein